MNNQKSLALSSRRHLVALAAWVALLATGGPLRAQEHPSPDVQRFAIVAGHNIGTSSSTPLRFAQKDAAKMAHLFATLGRIPSKNIMVLTAPSTADLEAAFVETSNRIRKEAGRRTELFVYYSGHADEHGLQLSEDLFAMGRLRTLVSESPASVTIAIIDACHSGAIVRDKGGKRVPLLDLSLSPDSTATGHAIITSSSAGEKSQESDELRGSFFTHFLASGMRGDADGSGDGKVTLYELYNYAYNKTRLRSLTSGGRQQHPSFDYAMKGQGQIVVTYPSSGLARLVLPADLSGNFLLYSPAQDSVLAEITKKVGKEAVLAVPPGVVELFKRTDSTLLRTRVEVIEGQVTRLEPGQMEEVSRTYLLEKGARPVVILGAKGGYQLFWNDTVRQRSILPSVIGGIELRVDNLLASWASPYVELLVGGGVASNSDTLDQPIATSTSLLEAGAGISFRLLKWPFTIELLPEAGIIYLRRKVESPQFAGPVNDDYAGPVTTASLIFSKEIIRGVSVGLQFKAGYYYFREDSGAKHLGFSEAFFTALMNL